jgi:hypothetical protein
MQRVVNACNFTSRKGLGKSTSHAGTAPRKLTRFLGYRHLAGSARSACAAAILHMDISPSTTAPSNADRTSSPNTSACRAHGACISMLSTLKGRLGRPLEAGLLRHDGTGVALYLAMQLGGWRMGCKPYHCVAPACTRASTAASWLLARAMARGVSPSLATWLRSAPACSSACMAST